MKTVLTGGKIITPYRILEDCCLVIEDGKIQDIVSKDTPVPADEVIDVKGRYISPGFIDLHIHGGGGFDFLDGTLEAVEGVAKTHMRHGTTTLTPTTTSCSIEEMYTLFDAVKLAQKEMKDGPNLPGMHLEGPYVNPARCGAQDASYLRAINKEEICAMLDYVPVCRMSIAPELEGGMEIGRVLRDRGIVTSICHSEAMYDEVIEACENGYSMVTHFYSGNTFLQRRTHRRELGIVETGYLVDELTVECITDGIHLPPELLGYILRFKPWDKITLCTDAVRGVDLPEGTIIKLGSLTRGQDCLIQGGVSMMMHGRSYGGSIATTDRCVRTMVQQAHVPLEAAVRMMSLNPARAMGFNTKGRIAIGMDADLCMFGEDIVVDAVMVGGRMTHNAMNA